MNKEHIYNNLDDLSSDQLCEYIKLGQVTIEELQSTGNLDASKRRAIRTCLEQAEKADENAWKEAQSHHTEEAYKNYLEKFPNSKYIFYARIELKNLEDKRIKEEEEKKRILSAIKNNPNAYPPGIIRTYLNDGSLSKSSLIDIGIPDEIIDRLYKNDLPRDWELGQTPVSIPDGYTEVYFWGIRGSGKTTALSAVLSTADKMGYLEIAQGPGYNYMLQLQNLFNNSIATLPGSTNTDVTQYLPFTLKKPKEKYYRSVSLIELSGEIFQCFLYKNANKPLKVQEEETFNSLLRFLKGDNRKLHFFFIDYDKSNRVDQDGYTQANYLNAAATFFNNPKYNIFRKSTDAIYIVITKSDLMPGAKESRIQNLSQYLNRDNYTAFVNSLKAKCEEHSINNGRLLGTPFSLGKVYFTEICEFDDITSQNIIDILMRRIPQSKKSILDVFNK
jgi:hypothetical protein